VSRTLRQAVIRLASQQPPGSSSRKALLEALAGYDANPDGEDIYPKDVDHGYVEPLAGGTDVMQQLQNRLLREQGSKPRDPNKRLDG